MSKTIAKTIYKDNYFLEFTTGFSEGFKILKRPELYKCDNDIHIYLFNKEGEQLLSATCHWGSYDVKENLWEIMPSHKPKSWEDSVKGYLTFKEVIKYIDREIRLEKNT